MANVYTGKVAIPGDKIDEYFSLMQKTEEGWPGGFFSRCKAARC